MNSAFERHTLSSLVDIDKKSLGKKTPGDYEFSYISLSNVSKGQIERNLERCIFSSAPSRARRVLQTGDILLATVRPNLQNFARVTGSFSDCIASTGFAVLTPKTNVSGGFVYQTLFSHQVTQQIESLVVGSNYPAINSSEVAGLHINVPPYPEQRKIAKILSTWDKAISTTEKLIETSKQQKKALMQQLLTGKKRFKDQSGNEFPKWINEPIGKYLASYKELVPANTEIPVLTSSRTGLYIQERSVINEGDYGVLPLGYFTYRHMSDDLIFKFNVNRTWKRGAVSKEYPVFKTVGLDSRFLESQLNEGNDFKRFAVQQKQGGTRTRLYFKNLKELKLNLPCLEEQQKIASVLTAADKEIELLEAKLAHLKQEKKALMQQLLTGKRRVKVPETEVA